MATPTDTPPEATLAAAEVERSIAELDDLALGDYGVRASEIAASGAPGEVDLLRLQRLVGVSWKRPFAEPAPFDPALENPTGSRHAWILTGTAFDPWSRRALGAVVRRGYLDEAPAHYPRTPEGAATWLEYEFAWAAPLLIAVHGAVCGAHADRFAAAVGLHLGIELSSHGAVVEAATAVGTWLGAHVSLLAGAPPTLLVAIAFLILAAGYDRFCALDPRSMAGKRAF